MSCGIRKGVRKYHLRKCDCAGKPSCSSMEHQVTLAIYDLSNGLARELSPALLGKQIDGIWHTAVRVYEYEFYFGGGICVDVIGRTPYGVASSTHTLGKTSKSRIEFEQFLQSVRSRFNVSSYHLLDNNCNHFSDSCAMFLVERHIPQYILDLPNEALNSAIGPILRPVVDSMQRSIIEQSMSHQMDFGQTSSPVNAAQPKADSRITPARSLTPIDITAAGLANNSIILRSGNLPAIRDRLRQLDMTLPTTILSREEAGKLIDFTLKSDKHGLFPALDLLRLTVADVNGNGVGHDGIIDESCEKVTALLKRFGCNCDKEVYGERLMTLRLSANLFGLNSSRGTLIMDTDAVDAALDAAARLWDAHDVGREKEKGSRRTLSIPTAGAVLLRNIATAAYKDSGLLVDPMIRTTYVCDEVLSESMEILLRCDSAADKDWIEQLLQKVVTPVLQAAFLLVHRNVLIRDVARAYKLDVDGVKQVAISCNAFAGELKDVVEALTTVMNSGE